MKRSGRDEDPQAGLSHGPVHWRTYQTAVSDLDLGGVIYHARYLEICDRVRQMIINGGGLEFGALWQKQLAFAVAECHQKFRRPVRMGQLKVATAFTFRQGTRLTVQHAFFPTSHVPEAKDDPWEHPERLYMATLTMVLVSTVTGWPVRPSATVIEALTSDNPASFEVQTLTCGDD